MSCGPARSAACAARCHSDGSPLSVGGLDVDLPDNTGTLERNEPYRATDEL